MTCKLLDKLQISRDCRTWQHSETPSWRIKGAIYEPKNIQSGKFVLFQRIYEKKNTQARPVRKEQNDVEKKKKPQKKKVTA